MAPHEYVSAVRSYVEKIGGRIDHCWSAEHRYPRCGRGSFEPRLEDWVTSVDRGGSSIAEDLREKLALSLRLRLVVLGTRDQLLAVVERRCPGRAPS